MENLKKEVSEKLLELNGEAVQLKVIIGELGELITEICDYFNNRPFRKKAKDTIKLLDEIADVELMLMQLKLILEKNYEVEPRTIECYFESKIKALHKQLNSNYKKELGKNEPG